MAKPKLYFLTVYCLSFLLLYEAVAQPPVMPVTRKPVEVRYLEGMMYRIAKGDITGFTRQIFPSENNISFSTYYKVGKWRFYYESGELFGEGEYYNNKPDGNWKYYYPSGKLFAELECNKGAATGRWKYYYENGNIFAQGRYQDNQRSGIWMCYFQDGKKAIAVDYDKGKSTSYYSNEKMHEEIGFLLGAKYEVFLTNYASYYPDGKKRIEGQFDPGKSYRMVQSKLGWFKLAGVWKTYWENGKQAVEYDFDQNTIKTINTEVEEKYRYNNKDSGYGKGSKVLQEFNLVRAEGAYWVRFNGVEDYQTDKFLVDPTTPNKQTMIGWSLEINPGSFHRNGPWEYRNGNNELISVINYAWLTNTPAGEGKFFYPNGKIQSEGMYDSSGKRTGIWKSYFKTGKTSEETPYESGVINGVVLEYFESGRMKSKAAHVEGKIVGIKELYHPNGKLLGKENYQQGKYINDGDFFDENGNVILQNGTGYRVSYFDNGNVSFKGNYMGGKRQGNSTWYFENGTKKEEGNYENGVLNGERKTYFEQGGLQERDTYSNGTLYGFVEYYHPNGKLHGKSRFSNGVFTAPDDYFDESGAPVLSNGSGISMTYHTNGKIASRMNYLNYCRSGKAEWFYDNGQPEQVAVYKYSENDKPFGLRWEIVSSFDRNGKVREKGTLKNGNGTWISYDASGAKSTVEYVNGKKK
jgi:antitoxin component YwqK of YwqJK toxin-antitoxin module